MSEFDLIRRYFTRPTPRAELGVGDDAALLRVAADMELAVSTDVLVSGIHFFATTDPFTLGHKALAVNLSDLAAMGATPRWATLGLTLPEVDESWLEAFSAGFFALAEAHGVELVGGDTTRGPLALSVTILGEVPAGSALRRDGAVPGDDLWLSGWPGRAAAGLAALRGELMLDDVARAACLAALHRPEPRVELGLALRGLASSAIDVSDGVLADLGHILERSAVGAELYWPAFPCHPALQGLTPEWREHCVLAGGDDYELCFTASPEQRDALQRLAVRLALPLSRIGRVVAGQGWVLRDAAGNVMTIRRSGYDHFQA